MRLVIQVVSRADVKIDGRTAGEIGPGMMVLLGVNGTDTEAVADKMVKKMLALRIFPDENGKTNRSLADIGGSLLIVSQFTLYADCSRGNRPSFIKAGPPQMANDLYEYVLKKCHETVPCVEHGEFGADMKVTLTNDGPFTIVLDSDDL